MKYVYRVIRSYDDIVRFECLPQNKKLNAMIRGNEFIVTSKNGFREMFTTDRIYEAHYIALWLYFLEIDSTLQNCQF